MDIGRWVVLAAIPVAQTSQPGSLKQVHNIQLAAALERRYVKGKGVIGTVTEWHVGSSLSPVNWSPSVLSLSPVLGAMAENLLCMELWFLLHGRSPLR